MRSSQDFNYNGALYIQKPDHSGKFKSFTQYIETVEKLGKIKTETIEGFKEIFLIEEVPLEESEFSQIPSEKIELEHWRRIFEIVIQTISDGTQKSKTVYKNKLLEELKKNRKKGEFPSHYSNKILRDALDIMIDIDFIRILKQPSGQIEIVDGYEKNLETFIQEAFKKTK